jgi:signal peptidase
MIKNKRFPFYIGLLLLPVALQVAWLFAPWGLLDLYNLVAKPFTYALMAAVLYGFFGRDQKPAPKGRHSLLLAGYGVLFYFTVILIASILFGAGRNVMWGGALQAARNLWVYAVPVCLSEVVRVKIIKGTPLERRGAMAVFITLALSFAQMDVLKFTQWDYAGAAAFIFESAFPIIVLHAVLTVMAFEGSLAAVLLIRCAYSLTPIFMPVLPTLTLAAWAVVNSVLLFATAVFYRFNMTERNAQSKLLEKRRAKYSKKSIAAIAVPVVAIALFVAFAARAFPYFPVVVRTGSMEGALDVGALVMVRNVDLKSAPDAVLEGDVILFKGVRTEIMHRAIEFRVNREGERVYVTKGDANTYVDAGYVEAEQVVGVARYYIPYIGYPVVVIRAIFGQ